MVLSEEGNADTSDGKNVDGQRIKCKEVLKHDMNKLGLQEEAAMNRSRLKS